MMCFTSSWASPFPCASDVCLSLRAPEPLRQQLGLHLVCWVHNQLSDGGVEVPVGGGASHADQRGACAAPCQQGANERAPLQGQHRRSHGRWRPACLQAAAVGALAPCSVNRQSFKLLTCSNKLAAASSSHHAHSPSCSQMSSSWPCLTRNSCTQAWLQQGKQIPGPEQEPADTWTWSSSASTPSAGSALRLGAGCVLNAWRLDSALRDGLCAVQCRGRFTVWLAAEHRQCPETAPAGIHTLSISSKQQLSSRHELALHSRAAKANS